MSAKRQAPWDYSHPKGDGTDVPTVPCEVGEAVGEIIARLADESEARMRAHDMSPPPRCGDCAFRRGSLPNRCLPTVANALKSVIEGEPFFCHHGLDANGEATRVCAGWIAARLDLEIEDRIGEALAEMAQQAPRVGEQAGFDSADLQGCRSAANLQAVQVSHEPAGGAGGAGEPAKEVR